MSEQNRRLRAAGIAALAWAGLAAVWCVLVPGGAAELPQGVPGTLRSLLVLPLAEELVFRGALRQAENLQEKRYRDFHRPGRGHGGRGSTL